MKDHGRGHLSEVWKTMRKRLKHLEESRGSEDAWCRPMHLGILMYKTMNQEIGGKQLRCSRYEQGCRPTASMPLYPINAPIVIYSGHNHHYGHDIEIGAFNEALRQRALVEGTSARTIFEEEARRFPNAALEVQTEQALRAIRYIRRCSSPPVHASGVRRLRGRGRQLVERPDPVPADPPVVGNLDAPDNNHNLKYKKIFEDVIEEAVVPGI
ncbi:Uncharacterized protein FWK35_00029765 [Aphis craccivora]|uniref:Uncharacterized protein n=1 Tax=Aphis craccivora TaxID=307492 RepID=A0A6G0Y2M0_APHCR|nr:Uncharacterized protein FWK35_00029765 [Aphis craccivora]